ncbi:MAG: Tryptophan-tRNA ligase [Candidatus Yanofskybacteria bacterium GW2011_GWF1_44_227]|nr:MAG: Tryptophan-tRNA ligase [Candidatus Yanofskybacteria bacterium GW2011_GWF1_44_227]
MSKPEYKVDIFTGIRPTGNLTVANYLGAVKPIVKLQSQGYRPLVFVADIHALTDNEPALVKKYTNEVVAAPTRKCQCPTLAIPRAYGRGHFNKSS